MEVVEADGRYEWHPRRSSVGCWATSFVIPYAKELVASSEEEADGVRDFANRTTGGGWREGLTKIYIYINVGLLVLPN